MNLLRSGWVPTALVLAVTVAVLRYYDVSFRDTAVFGASVILGKTVPGVLLWRACRGGSRFFAEEVAAGTVLGHAIIVLGYVPARWAGYPLLVLVWPGVTVAAFLVVPALRRFWRGAGNTVRVPAPYAWGTAVLIAFTVLSSGSAFFRHHGLAWPGYARPYVDLPFHLGLVGELKYHMPPAYPSVAGEPLYYHWFAYADMAATSWVTGIEPQTLVYRLFMLPILAASLVLFFAIGRRLTGRWWPGLAALGIAFLAWAPTPYVWAPSLGAHLLSPDEVAWYSPTHGFGVMLFAPVVLLLVDILRQPRSGAGPWTLFVTLLMAVMGGKAVFLPILLAGLSAVVIATMVAQRRLHRPAVVAILAAMPSVLIAQFVLFGGQSDGMIVHPGSAFATVAAETASTPDPPVALEALVALLSAFGRVCIWAGVFGLAVRRKTFCDPPILLILGMSVAGVAAGMILRFPGSSQLFFYNGVIPYISLAAACGLATVFRERITPGFRVALLSAAGGGVVTFLAVRELDGSTRPTADVAVLRILGPFVALVAITGVFVVVLAMLGRRHRVLRPLSPAFVVAFFTGMALPASLFHVRQMWQGPASPPLPRTTISSGILEAGRWLRDHSRPDDLVATNSVCTNECHNRNFFAVSAYTERRILVEDWGFELKTHAEAMKRNVPDETVPFWDRRRLADNDAAFHRPSSETVRRLRDAYGVRWLFVDRSYDRPAPGLGRFAWLRHEAGACAVYEIPN
ncbi:hypothetical protein NE236_26480 [Actinoallomurus purpureus]|uniref:hypothetical protein n=1 Tax=Actinoallomurus purpureus TaxID=478114 RepID=UPI00209378BE|nr:hypothetical protein [Actinoallomurus purpureus]MCO6008525.1 hypothetical protein [Actinoallomurus purpureus]